MDIYKAMNMSEDEYTEYLIEEYKNKDSYKDIIKKSGKTAEELVREMNSYDINLLKLVKKYKLSLKNKAEFINKLISLNDNIDEIMILLSCFICESDYIFNIKDKKITAKNNAKLVEYITLKEKIELFNRYYSDIKLNEVKYKQLLKKIKLENDNNKSIITSNTKKLLIELYNEYISEQPPLIDNIEHIHKFSMCSEARQNIYPLLVFQAFTKYKSKIPKMPLILNEKNIMNYKRYTAIEKNNGKNFKTYDKYITLFLKLLDSFSGICNIKMCMYGFEKSSNLVEWMMENTLYKDIFHYSRYSLVQSTYKSIFDEKSMFWEMDDLSYDDFIEYNKIDIINGDRQLSLIQNKLSKDNKEVSEYLNEYAKDSEASAIYVKNLTDSIFDISKYRAKGGGMDTYLYMTVEGELQVRGDKLIKEDIIKFL